MIERTCDVVVDLEKARDTLNDLKRLSRDACDTLHYRIEAVLEKIASVELCVLPNDEPVTVDEFLAAVEASCSEAAITLTKSAYLTSLCLCYHWAESGVPLPFQDTFTHQKQDKIT